MGEFQGLKVKLQNPIAANVTWFMQSTNVEHFVLGVNIAEV
jgi:hypothetical protein